MTISSSTFISDTILFIRNLLRSNVTDPLSRANGIGFCMTAFPKRNIQYPVITVRNTGLNSSKLGMQSEKQWITFTIEVSIYTKSATQTDKLTQEVIEVLRTNQLGSDSTDSEEIFGFTILSVVPIVELEGELTLHRKVITLNYTVIL